MMAWHAGPPVRLPADCRRLMTFQKRLVVNQHHGPVLAWSSLVVFSTDPDRRRILCLIYRERMVAHESSGPPCPSCRCLRLSGSRIASRRHRIASTPASNAGTCGVCEPRRLTAHNNRAPIKRNGSRGTAGRHRRGMFLSTCRSARTINRRAPRQDRLTATRDESRTTN
jgi:hypothetical protein